MPRHLIDPKDQWFVFQDTRPEASERSNFTGAYDSDLAYQIASEAIKQNVNPYLLLGMAMQESTLGKTTQNNPLHVDYRAHGLTGGKDLLTYGTAYLKDRMNRYGEDKGIQAYNGLGRLGTTEGRGTKSWYGSGRGIVDTSKTMPYTARVRALQKVFEQTPHVQSIVQDAATQAIQTSSYLRSLPGIEVLK